MNTKQDIANHLQIELRKLFPNNGVQVNVWRSLGDDIINVTYTSGIDKNEWSNGIINNDPALSIFLLKCNKDGSVEIDPLTCGIHRCFKTAGIGAKFRKITAKSEQEAATKLLNWFTKNQLAIQAIPKRY